LHELERLQDRLEIGDRGSALMTMKRILTILKTIVAQIDVLETMTPLGFSSFRGRLERASGFQSAQFRELEAVLGGRDQGVLSHHPAGPDRDRIEAAMSRRSVWDSFLLHLDRLGHPIPEAEHEADALARWDGDGAVRLLDRSEDGWAVLLERCVPGTPLSAAGPDAALGVLTRLLARLWVPAGAPFHTLADEAAWWA